MLIGLLYMKEIEAPGSHEELIEASPIYREIYESQQKGVIGAWEVSRDNVVFTL